MPRESEPSTIESSFVLRALQEGKRLDGRGIYDFREISLKFGDEPGYVECRLGETRVVAQVSAEVVKPSSDRPFEGFFIVVTEMNAMAASNFDNFKPSEEEIHVSRLLEKTLRRSGAVDREALCIAAGKLVWSIRLDIHFLNDEGNVLDCATIAGMAALGCFRKEDVEVKGEDEVVFYSKAERIPTPLALHHRPLSITFAFFSDPSLMILDPNHLETQLSTGYLTLCLNSLGEICLLQKSGGTPLDASQISKAVQIANARVKTIDTLVKSSLEEERKKKWKEVF